MIDRKPILIAAVAAFVLYLLTYNAVPALGSVLFYLSLALIITAVAVPAIRKASKRRKQMRQAELDRQRAEMEAQLEREREAIDAALSDDAADEGVEYEGLFSSAGPDFERVILGPEMLVPEFDPDMGTPPFDMHEYVTLRTVIRNAVSGAIVSERKSYYLDNPALEKTERYISALEFIIEQHGIDIGGLAPLKTDFRMLRPALASDTVDSLYNDRVPAFSVSRRTPTGRAPKYPFSVVFDAQRANPDALQSNGTLEFLNDGSIGKASIYYRNMSGQYSAHFKLFDGDIDLNVLTYQGYDGISETLYRHG